MLIGQFWGTSAAEGIPAPFCRCDVCDEARREGGVYQRMRSSFRLTDKIIIDLGADAVSQSARFGDLSTLEHVLITHTHEDHFNPHMMMEAFWCRARGKTLHYYFTDGAYDMAENLRSVPWMLKGKVPGWEKEGIVAFHRLEYGKRYAVDDMWVTPFSGNHKGNVGELSAMYLIELPDGWVLFYGLDSGPYFEETFDALKGKHVDIFISESTDGDYPQEPSRQHLSAEGVREVTERLLSQGTLTKESVLYLTHINHSTSHGRMLKEVERLNFPIPTTVAYDGLKIL